jgi:hypothetical protein
MLHPGQVLRGSLPLLSPKGEVIISYKNVNICCKASNWHNSMRYFNTRPILNIKCSNQNSILILILNALSSGVQSLGSQREARGSVTRQSMWDLR